MTEEPENNILRKALNHTQIYSIPKKKVATFHPSVYTYYMATKKSYKETWVREGILELKTANIVTPSTSLHDVFDGFPSKTHGYIKEILKGKSQKENLNLAIIEYRIRNISREKWVEKAPLYITIKRMKEMTAKDKDAILLSGLHEMWMVSLLKACFTIIDESISDNYAEIEECGFLDKDGIPPAIYREIEGFFSSAKKNKSHISQLGDILVKHNLFERYENRFFSLMESHR